MKCKKPIAVLCYLFINYDKLSSANALQSRLKSNFTKPEPATLSSQDHHCVIEIVNYFLVGAKEPIQLVRQ